jgi:hypothetical protein
MDYYKIGSIVPTGEPKIVNDNILSDLKLTSDFMRNSYGELASDLIIHKKIDDMWVKITRSDFATVLRVPCVLYRDTVEEGDTLEGATSHPVTENLDEDVLRKALETKVTPHNSLGSFLLVTKPSNGVDKLLKESGYVVNSGYIELALDTDPTLLYGELLTESEVKGSLLLRKHMDKPHYTIEILAVESGKNRSALVSKLLRNVHDLGKKNGVEEYMLKQAQTVGTDKVASEFKFTSESLKRQYTGIQREKWKNAR